MAAVSGASCVFPAQKGENGWDGPKSTLLGHLPGFCWHLRCCCYRSVTKSCLTLWPHGPQHTKFPLSFTISPSLLQIMSLELVMLTNHLILCHPLLFLPSIFPSTRVFSSESALCVRWSKYQSFNISPSNKYSVLISFRIDRFDLLEVQGTLKGLLQHHSMKASILWHSAFITVQLSHAYMTTAKPQLWLYGCKNVKDFWSHGNNKKNLDKN